MLISEENNTEISIYGKTGMGKAEGIVVDAWFTGFAETLEGNKYFCVYLGQSDASSTYHSNTTLLIPVLSFLPLTDHHVKMQTYSS